MTMNKKTLIAGLAIGLGAMGIQHAQANPLTQLNFGGIGNSQMYTTTTATLAGDANAKGTLTYSANTAVGAPFNIQIQGTVGGVQSPMPTTTNPQSANQDFGQLKITSGTLAVSGLVLSPYVVPGIVPHTQFNDVAESANLTGTASILLVDKGYTFSHVGYTPTTLLTAPFNLSHEFKATVVFDNITLTTSQEVNTITHHNIGTLDYTSEGVSSATVTYNLLGATYGGTQADLLALLALPSTISTSWAANRDLTQLFDKGNVTHQYSYTGVISPQQVPDGGMTLVLLGVALSGVVLMKRQTA